MADNVIKRVHYFDHQFLQVDDFTLEQDYHKEMRRRHNRLFHTWGVAEGLAVDFPAGGASVTVGEGTAYDGQGRELVLMRELPLDLSSHPADADVYVTIAYRETPSDHSDATGAEGYSRWTEDPLVAASDTAPGDPSQVLLLARVQRTGTEVTGIATSDRRLAGAVGGDLLARSVTLSDPARVPAQWAGMRLGDANRADLSGSLKVSGDLNVAGTVHGTLPAAVVGTTQLQDGAVVNAKIADGAVSDTKLVNNAVTTPKLADSAVVTTKLSDGSVATTKLAAFAVNDTKLATNAVTVGKIADGAVAEPKLATGAVSTRTLQAGAVTDAVLRSDATLDANRAVTTAHLRDSAVTTAKIADGAVTGAKILDGTVATPELATGAVTTAKIADGAVTAAKLDPGVNRGVLRAFVTINGSAGTILTGFNVASVNRIAVGQYDITWASPVNPNGYGPFVCWSWIGGQVRHRSSDALHLSISVFDSSGTPVDSWVSVMVAM